MEKSRKSKPSHADTENLKTSDLLSSSSVVDLTSIQAEFKNEPFH